VTPTGYPKWDAYLQLTKHIPERYLCGHRLCRTDEELGVAWYQLENEVGKCGVRTDQKGGGVGLPFRHHLRYFQARAFARTVRKQGLVAILAESIDADINGKAVRLDEDTVLVEWAYCETARDFDVAAVDCAASILVSQHRWHPLSPDGCPRKAYTPEEAAGRFNLGLGRLYQLLLSSGLPETAWSSTEKERRLVLWG